MAVINPAIPDFRPLSRKMLLGRTDARDRVSYTEPDRHTPSIEIQGDGGRPVPEDNRIGRTRLIFLCRGKNTDQAWRVGSQVQDRFFPPELVAGSIDEKIEDVRVMGARMEAPLREDRDERNLPMVTVAIEVTYFREET